MPGLCQCIRDGDKGSLMKEKPCRLPHLAGVLRVVWSRRVQHRRLPPHPQETLDPVAPALLPPALGSQVVKLALGCIILSLGVCWPYVGPGTLTRRTDAFILGGILKGTSTRATFCPCECQQPRAPGTGTMLLPMADIQNTRQKARPRRSTLPVEGRV